MRLPVPDPRDLLHVLERAAAATEQLLAAVPRTTGLLDEAGRLLGRVDALVERIEGTRAAADEVVRRTDATVSRADAVLSASEPLITRLRTLLDTLEPPLTSLQPTLERLAQTTSAAEVDALVELIDHLPGLARKMEVDIVPVLNGMSTVAPDIHDLLDASRELNEMLASLPGMGRIMKRIDEEQAADGRA